MPLDPKRMRELRVRAEDALRRSEVEGQAEAGAAHGPVHALPDCTTIAEELRIYHAELEQQNLELMESSARAQELFERYHALFANLPMPAVVVKSDGVISEVNTKSVEAFGFPARSLIQRSIYRLLADHDDARLGSLLKAAPAEGTAFVTETRFLTARGQSTPFRVHAFRLPRNFQPDGQFLLLLENRRVEAALQETNALYELVKKTSDVGVWDWDLRSDHLTWDDISWNMLGLAPRPLCFADWQALVHPDDLGPVLERLNQLLAGGAPFRMEFRYRTASGVWTWVDGRGQITHRDDQGAPMRMVGTHINIDEIRHTEERNRLLSEQLEKLAAQVPGILFQFQQSPDGRAKFPYVSTRALDWVGMHPETLANDARPAFEILSPNERQRLWENIERSRRELCTTTDQYRLDLPDGRQLWVGCDASPEALEDGSTIWHGYLRDITQAKSLEAAREEDHLRLSNIIWGTGAGTWEWNLATSDFRVNPLWAEQFGYTLAELEPIALDTWKRLTHPEDLEHARAQLDRHLRGESDRYECEIRIRHRDGHWVWVLDRGRIVSRGEDGRPLWLMGIRMDIDERKRAEQKLARLAHFDALTNLPRRTLFDERLAQALKEAKRHHTLVAVGYMDLDGFKTVNDQHGHSIGDALLVEFAKRMSDTLREMDTIARLGGDEFGFILKDLETEADAHASVERLLEALEKPATIEHRVIALSASIGLTFYQPLKSSDGVQLLKLADQAMYQAKQEGKARYRITNAD